MSGSERFLNERVKGLEPYEPAAATYKVRLDANESFVQLPPSLRERISQKLTDFSYNRYPDPMAAGVIRGYSEYIGLPPDCLTAGNGSDELIGLILTSFLSPGDKLLMFSPDFSMYSFYSHLSALTLLDMKKDGSPVPDLPAALRLIEEQDVKAVIFSNPCNPTGGVIPAEQVREFVNSTKALVLLDEAYMDFGRDSIMTDVPKTENLIVLRTCSKAFGLAGLRLGFAAANPTLTRALRTIKSPFNVNALTQLVAETVLSDPEFIKASVQSVIDSRDSLLSGLRSIGAESGGKIKPYDTAANFILVETADAEALHKALLSRSISIRLLTPTRLRVTAGTKEENAAVTAALREILQNGGENE